jgi:hypothetical protein
MECSAFRQHYLELTGADQTAMDIEPCKYGPLLAVNRLSASAMPAFFARETRPEHARASEKRFLAALSTTGAHVATPTRAQSCRMSARLVRGTGQVPRFDGCFRESRTSRATVCTWPADANHTGSVNWRFRPSGHSPSSHRPIFLSHC